MIALILSLALAQMRQPVVVIDQSSGGCAGSPDLSSVIVSTTWHNSAACTATDPMLRAYTNDNGLSTTFDYPDAMVFSQLQAPVSPDDCGLFTAPTVGTGGFVGSPSCVYSVDYTGTGDDCEFASEAASGTTGWTLPGTSGQMMFSFHHNPGTDDAMSGGPQLLLIGSGNMSVKANNVSTDELRLVFTDNSSVATNADTTSDASTCCGGSDCNNFFASGEPADDAVMYISFTWEVGTASADYTRLYINSSDGSSGATRCLVTENTGLSLDDTDGWATSERWKLGSMGNADGGDWRFGDFWISTDPTIDLFNLVSGGDGDMTDGDECLCTDVGGGTDCAG